MCVLLARRSSIVTPLLRAAMVTLAATAPLHLEAGGGATASS
jgi:hypothetical protein